MQDVSANHTGWGVWGLPCQRRNSTRMQNAPKKSANAIFSQDFHHLEGVLMHTLTCRSTGTAVLVLRLMPSSRKWYKKTSAQAPRPSIRSRTPSTQRPWVSRSPSHTNIQIMCGQALFPLLHFRSARTIALNKLGNMASTFSEPNLMSTSEVEASCFQDALNPINPKLSSNRCRLCHASNIFEQRFERLSYNLKPIGAHQTSTIHSMALPMTVSQKPS